MRLPFISLSVLRVLALATLALPFGLFAQQQQQAPPAVVLPPVTAEALNKTKWSLPAQFSSPLNLLILCFTRDQQQAVETWLPITAPGESTNSKVQTWVLPVSARQDVLYKWWLNSSMRGGLPANESPRYTVPLYVNKPQFLKSLGILSERQIVILLTDRTGLVLWRSEGPSTDQKKASLADFLRTSPLAR